MKKKILISIITTILSISLLGCNSSSNKPINSSDDSLVTSTEDNYTDKEGNNFGDLNNLDEETDVMKDFTTGNLTIQYSSSKWSYFQNDDYELCLLGKNNSLFNIVTESMQGLSEEEYNKMSDLDVHTNLGINSIHVEEKYFNNNKARVTNYYQEHEGIKIPTYQVTFLNDGQSYIFTLMARDTIDDDLMSEFTKILDTVTFS